MIKNPYLYSYLPLITIILFSLTFGLFSVNEAIILFRKIGVYGGMHEFLSDVQMRMLLLIVFSTLYFMVFSALKLIGETIHNVGMLFSQKTRLIVPSQKFAEGVSFSSSAHWHRSLA